MSDFRKLLLAVSATAFFATAMAQGNSAIATVRAPAPPLQLALAENADPFTAENFDCGAPGFGGIVGEVTIVAGYDLFPFAPATTPAAQRLFVIFVVDARSECEDLRPATMNLADNGKKPAVDRNTAIAIIHKGTVVPKPATSWKPGMPATTRHTGFLKIVPPRFTHNRIRLC